MAEFVYNAKNINTSRTLFKLNYSYYLQVLFKEDVDPYSRFRSTNKLADELKKLIEIYYQNLLHA